MNRRVLLVGLAVALPLVVLLVASLSRDPTRIDSPLIGRAAPAFRLIPLDGGDPLTLQSLRGRAVVVNFWATWCVPCVAEHAALVQAAQSSGTRVAFVGVVYQDQDSEVRAFLRQHGASYPMVMDPDGRAAIAYGVYGVPETFFISADGIIVNKQTGTLSAARLEQLVAALARPADRGPS